MRKVIIRRDSYFDSVFLMALTARLRERLPLDDAVVAMAAPHNKELLVQGGYDQSSLTAAGAADLVIAVTGTAQQLETVERLVDELLAAEEQEAEKEQELPRSLGAALEASPQSNLVLISLPGGHVTREARQALADRRHVMIFSDNVPLADEVALKTLAQEQGVLCMGPDCGTAIVSGMPLGFANVVRKGTIGIVGASGTGIQEVTSAIDRLGGGVSQAIGTGGRDLSADVGGRTALAAVEALTQDAATKVIVLISKPPAPEVATQVIEALRKAGKPAVVHLLGVAPGGTRDNLHFAGSLAETAELACQLAGYGEVAQQELPESLVQDLCSSFSARPSLLGLFCGGTTAYEALCLLERADISPASNLGGDAGAANEVGLVLDLGADEYTQGRPHPMIEPVLRNEALQTLAPADGCLLLFDLVIGFGAHSDPAGVLADGLSRLPQGTWRAIASITGTAADPQGYEAQRDTLRDAGVSLVADNRRAAELAAAVLSRSGQ